MDVRPATEADLPAIERTWREVGWIDDDDDATRLPDFFAEAVVHVAVVDGEAEASAFVHDGTLLHTATELPCAVVSAVTTSRVARRQGAARAALTTALVAAAERGAAVSVLGMFEQGYYDTFGFGTGAEMLFHRIDPSSLPADLPYRRPVRLSLDDHAEIAALLCDRDRGHGAVAIPAARMQRAELGWASGGFGLGYRDEHGALTHYVWCATKGEHGPYRVHSWAWRTDHELLELLGLVRSLHAQVHWVDLPEPFSLQLAAMVALPARQWSRTKGTEHHYRVDADAWWQARVLDVPACVAALDARDEVRFDLTLADPLADAGLPAVAGDWSVRLAPDGSSATRGHAGDVPRLACTVNAFTRLWLGVRRPAVLATTDGTRADDGLLQALDEALRLPRPDPGMNF